MTLLKKETIDGTAFELSVDADGEFRSEFAGETVSASSLKALVEKLRGLVRVKPIAVKATLFEDEGWRHKGATFADIIVTGIHSGNGNVLFKVDRKGAPTQQFKSYRGTLLKRVTPAEVKAFRAIEARAEAARKEMEAFKKAREFRPHVELQVARGGDGDAK